MASNRSRSMIRTQCHQSSCNCNPYICMSSSRAQVIDTFRSYSEQIMTTSAECTHLPLPELAHTRESLSVPAHTVSCTPGFSHSTRLARKDRDFRRRTYVRHIEMMMARKPTPEDLEEPFLKYFKTQRVQYGEDASCVFLLWGSLTPFQSSKFQVLKAIDIPIKSAGDTRIGKASEEKVLLDMRRAFHKHTKSWATYLGLRIISSVKPIKVIPSLLRDATIY